MKNSTPTKKIKRQTTTLEFNEQLGLLTLKFKGHINMDDYVESWSEAYGIYLTKDVKYFLLDYSDSRLFLAENSEWLSLFVISEAQKMKHECMKIARIKPRNRLVQIFLNNIDDTLRQQNLQAIKTFNKKQKALAWFFASESKHFVPKAQTN